MVTPGSAAALLPFFFRQGCSESSHSRASRTRAAASPTGPAAARLWLSPQTVPKTAAAASRSKTRSPLFFWSHSTGRVCSFRNPGRERRPSSSPCIQLSSSTVLWVPALKQPPASPASTQQPIASWPAPSGNMLQASTGASAPPRVRYSRGGSRRRAILRQAWRKRSVSSPSVQRRRTSSSSPSTCRSPLHTVRAVRSRAGRSTSRQMTHRHQAAAIPSSSR